MNRFEQVVENTSGTEVYCSDLDTIQVNLGLVCNQGCAHCHVGAGPARTESMDRPTMALVVKAAREAQPGRVDITGGAPELNPHFRWFVERLTAEGLGVQVRTNLTAMLVPGMEDTPRFLSEMGAGLAASMPCYLEENVAAQRGPGVYRKSVEALKVLNGLGYGTKPGLRLDLVYNPGGAFLPPDQARLEADYRRELSARFGIVFNSLIAIANMPVGRFWDEMKTAKKDVEYLRLLEEAFNPGTLDGLMCRHQVSIGWDGTLYDCDFNLALGLPADPAAPGHIRGFDHDALARRRVVTGAHCFGCTAGRGSSCGGVLV